MKEFGPGSKDLKYFEKDGDISSAGSARPLKGDRMDTTPESAFEKQKENDPVIVLGDIFGSERWLDSVLATSNPELAKFYIESLVNATEGMGYCIDERPVTATVTATDTEAQIITKESQKELLKPAFVGGAGGWVVMFMMRGMPLAQALDATDALYKKMEWGPMMAHIDDHHGDESDPEKIAKLRAGCGFLGKAGLVLEQARIVLPDLAPGAEYTAESGKTILEYVLAHNGTLVVVSGHHDSNANVVVNTHAEKTLDRNQLPAGKKAYLWDIHASTDNRVWEAFTSLDTNASDLSESDFARMQAFMHVATAFALGAMDPAEPGKNFAVLN